MIADRGMMETLDAVGRRYGVRPSALIGETSPLAAFTIDVHAHNRGVMRDERIARKLEAGRGRR